MLAPSCVPSAPGHEIAGGDFDRDAISSLLKKNDIAGLAEVMDMSGGFPGPALQAYIAAGNSSDHELTSASDLLEKLHAGLFIELRGSHPCLLPEFAETLQALPSRPPTLTLCTDDVFPGALHENGALDHVFRLLVQHGPDPMRALQAATLNAAHWLGRV